MEETSQIASGWLAMVLLTSSLLERSKFIRLVRVNRVLSENTRTSITDAFLWDDLSWIRISDPRLLRSWCIKGADESVTRVD